MNKIYDPFMIWITNDEMWQSFGVTLLRIVIILLIGRVLIWLLHKAVDRTVLEQANKRPVNHARRMTTVGKLLKNVSSYIIYFIVFMLLLSEIGINLGPLLAGAGVMGLAIGFGAQSLVKDVISGFFIILEDQFAVGDVIQTGTFKGTVEVIGLRTTKIQSWTGEIHIVPNGMINQVTNFSIHNSLAAIDVSISYEADVEKTQEIIEETMKTFSHEHLVKQPEVLGLQLVSGDSVNLRIIAECEPTMQAIVARAMNREIKDALVRNGIAAPYAKMVMLQRTNGEG